MNRVFGLLLAGALAAGASPALAGGKDGPKKGVFQAERAGWLLGMYVGEEKDRPFPFITQVDPDSEARVKGIRPGDELIRFEGEETTPLRRLFDRVSTMRPGMPATLWIRRGTETLRFELRIPRPPKPGEEAKASKKKEDEKARSEQSADRKDKKKKKQPPVVIKPIPGPGS